MTAETGPRVIDAPFCGAPSLGPSSVLWSTETSASSGGEPSANRMTTPPSARSATSGPIEVTRVLSRTDMNGSTLRTTWSIVRRPELKKMPTTRPMSTVPEVILARFLGLRVAACSVITNLAAGMMIDARDGAKALLTLARQAPELAARTDRLSREIDLMAEHGLRFDETTARAIGKAEARYSRSGRVALWVIALTLVYIAWKIL